MNHDTHYGLERKKKPLIPLNTLLRQELELQNINLN